jgi:hypothetical protein
LNLKAASARKLIGFDATRMAKIIHDDPSP